MVLNMNREKDRSGVNFTNILRAAFTNVDPKSTKKTVNSSSFLCFLGSLGVKAAHKQVDKIDRSSVIKYSSSF